MATMTLAELKAATISEIARKKADEDAVAKRKQIEEFDGNASELKDQLEKHLPVQLVKEYGVEYRQSTSSNALVMAVIDYRGAEISIWKAPASSWTHWDIEGAEISKPGVASEGLTQVLLVDFIDAIDKAVSTYKVAVTIEIEVEATSANQAKDEAEGLVLDIKYPFQILRSSVIDD
jgi:hypothetical protein